jgi:hypothetical protein
MLINLSPQFSDRRISVTVTGDVVNINGVDFDFTPLEVGASIPAEAVSLEYFWGFINRDDAGELVMTLMFPHDWYASYDARFPQPISVTEDGPVNLPDPEAEPDPDAIPEPEPEPEVESEGGEA